MPTIKINIPETDYKKLQLNANLNNVSIQDEILSIITSAPINPAPLNSHKAKKIMSALTPDKIDSVQTLARECRLNNTVLPTPIPVDKKAAVPVGFKVTPEEYALIRNLKEVEHIDTITGTVRYAFYVGLRHLYPYDGLPPTPPNIKDFRLN